MFWIADNVKWTGWHQGWYMAVVNDPGKVNDLGKVNITYVVEPSESYEDSVEEFFCILFVFNLQFIVKQLTNYTITRIHCTTIHYTRLPKNVYVQI